MTQPRENHAPLDIGRPYSKKRQQAFNELVRTHSDFLYRSAYWLCRDRSEAEDLVQEAFLRAWKGFDSLQEAKAAKSWLYTIMRRQFLNQIAKQVPDHVSIEEWHYPATPAIDETLEQRDVAMLRQLMAELPLNLREPLSLQLLGGLAGEDIARLLQVPLGTVKTRLFRARQQLTKALGPEALEKSSHRSVLGSASGERDCA
ncbi:MAG: sigma-70 family RNA polymerase sigma factor [Pseudomonadota bacterium]|nr:MAG: sigma-70 family RNA polymerase sigma factor [Pseudomonadota bacterium]